MTTFLDEDGDGWGGPGELGEVGCVTALPDGAAGNDLDCDDSDPAITGLVSRACPDALDPSPDASFTGLVVGQREFLAFHGATDTVRYNVAAARCEGWAVETSEAAREGQRGLATLQDSNEQQAIPDWLAGLTGVEPGFAGFVDLRYEADGQDWRWPDGSLPEGIPLCDGVPALEDFLIDLAPQDPKREELLDEIAENARLALVRTEQGWCFGAPTVGGGAEPQHAQAFCERPAPNPVDYPTVAF